MLLNSDYDWTPASQLDGKVVGYYFAASWDKRCKVITPIIAATYRKIVERGDKFGIVYVGFDRDERSFRNFIASMPWLSMPCGHSGIQELSKLWDVRDLPTLVILDADSNVITKDGARLMVQDREGAGFPWRPKPVFELLGSVDKVLGASGPVDPEFGAAEYTGLLFGGAWAKPVQDFTPRLRAAFESIAEAGHSFQIFYVPSDKDEEQYNTFVSSQPWLALPFKTPLKPELSRKYNVERIPRLVIVDRTGQVVCEDACPLVVNDPTAAGFPWAPRAAYTFSDIAVARQFPGHPTVMLLLDGVPDGKDKTQAIAAFEAVAETTRKLVAGNRHQAAPLFLYGDESHLLTRKARAFAGFSKIPPPNLLITDGAKGHRYLWGPKGGRMGRVFPKEEQVLQFVRSYMGSHLSGMSLPKDAAEIGSEIATGSAKGGETGAEDTAAGGAGTAGASGAAGAGAGAGAGARATGSGTGPGARRRDTAASSASGDAAASGSATPSRAHVASAPAADPKKRV